MDAEIMSVDKPGEKIVVIVSYKEGSFEVRESISFNEGVSQSKIMEEIDSVGQRILNSRDLEALAKGMIGQKIPVIKKPPRPIPIVGSF